MHTFLFTLFFFLTLNSERFLVLLNDILALGVQPSLYATEEIDAIVTGITNRVKTIGQVPDRETCWAEFVSSVRKNLHIILCFSPVGDELRTRCKKFPALASATSIDWFAPWPAEALLSVGKKLLQDVDLGGDNSFRSSIEQFMPMAFNAVNIAAAKATVTEGRIISTTPKSFIEMVKLFVNMLAKKRNESSKAIDRLSSGLHKLRDTATAVAIIEETLKVKY
jgi:dynein heavy chain, axonemal